MEQRLDAATLRRLAVRASCSTQTIQKVFQGRPVRGLAFYRAKAALVEAGLFPKCREDEGDPHAVDLRATSFTGREGK